MSVRERNGRIQIDFYYRSVRCRETIPLKYTKANKRYANNLLATIKHEIAINTFEYRKYFPNSKTHSAMCVFQRSRHLIPRDGGTLFQSNAYSDDAGHLIQSKPDTL